MSNAIADAVMMGYRQRRDAALNEANARRAELHARFPEVAKIDSELAQTGPKIYNAAMTPGAETKIPTDDEIKARMAEIRRETEELRARRAAILEQNGLPADYSEPKYRCSMCSDSGYIKTELCPCYKKAIARAMYEASGLGRANADKTFESFDLRYYTGIDREGRKVREHMEKIYELCKRYAKNFDGTESMLMVGATGLGKTHLSSAIARKVIDKGYNVVYDSAQTVFDTFEAKKYGKDQDADTDRYMDCSLLIIDDLGAEHITPYTVSVLYNLVNTRLSNRKSILISTNLTPTELKTKYESRILSRLLGECKVLQFLGNDIRLLKLSGGM